MFFLFNTTKVDLLGLEYFKDFFSEEIFLTSNPKRTDTSFCPSKTAEISELFIKHSDGIIIEPVFKPLTGFNIIDKTIYYELCFAKKNDIPIYVLTPKKIILFSGEVKKLPRNLVNENEFARLKTSKRTP